MGTLLELRDYRNTTPHRVVAVFRSSDVPDRHLRATVRKVILHTLLHEVRHWAQIARLVRERGFVPPGGHDLLTSDALE